jgi:copper(I)-binding protein
MVRSVVRRSVLVVILVALAACSSAPGSSGVPTISDAWARPGAAGAQSAAYMTITGAGQDDALVSVSSTGAATVELHESTTDAAGMMGMHPIERLDVPGDGSVRLEPGSFHVMLMGLSDELAVGDILELELVFEKAGTVAVDAEIRQD